MTEYGKNNNTKFHDELINLFDYAIWEPIGPKLKGNVGFGGKLLF